MGDIIVKPQQDEDFYVLWNLHTDSPFSWGTRKQLEKLSDRHFPLLNREARFQRADATSTSGRGAYASTWDEDEEYIYHLQYSIKRSRIRELCELLDKLPQDGSQDENGDVMLLMVPVEYS